MDLEYNPKREAVAARKLAAEAKGAERQRWITAALAWSELTRLPGSAEGNLAEESPTWQLVAGAKRCAFPTPSQAARSAFRGKCDAAPVYDLNSSLARLTPPAEALRPDCRVRSIIWALSLGRLRRRPAAQPDRRSLRPFGAVGPSLRADFASSSGTGSAGHGRCGGPARMHGLRGSALKPPAPKRRGHARSSSSSRRIFRHQ
jgi:hypothetical protein